MWKSSLTTGTVAGTCERGDELYICTKVRQHLDKRDVSLKDYPTYNMLY